MGVVVGATGVVGVGRPAVNEGVPDPVVLSSVELADTVPEPVADEAPAFT